VIKSANDCPERDPTDIEAYGVDGLLLRASYVTFDRRWQAKQFRFDVPHVVTPFVRVVVRRSKENMECQIGQLKFMTV